MLSKLTIKQQQWLFYATIVLVIYMAYHFSISHTVDAIKLNHQLTKEQNNAQGFDQSVDQVEKTNAFYQTVLKTFYVKKDDRENRLWQAVSGMALLKKVAINFSPGLQSTNDTLTTKNVVEQNFMFKGNYFNLIQLLDTLSKSKGIGKISELELANLAQTDENKRNELALRLKMVGVER